VAKTIFEVLNLQGSIYIDTEVVTSDQIKDINTYTRGIKEPTDVLSFPFIEFKNGIKKFDKYNYPYEWDSELKAVNIGSVVVCQSIAINQAKEYWHSVDRELNYLFVHGVLHLFGYDHNDSVQKRQMRDMEEKILNKCGFDRTDIDND